MTMATWFFHSCPLPSVCFLNFFIHLYLYIYFLYPILMIPDTILYIPHRGIFVNIKTNKKRRANDKKYHSSCIFIVWRRMTPYFPVGLYYSTTSSSNRPSSDPSSISSDESSDPSSLPSDESPDPSSLPSESILSISLSSYSYPSIISP